MKLYKYCVSVILLLAFFAMMMGSSMLPAFEVVMATNTVPLRKTQNCCLPTTMIASNHFH